MTPESRRMKALFIGDSIIEGSIGVNFTDIIERQNPGITVLNHGIPGDTLPGISRRLLRLVAGEENFDLILLEGGHNDILMAPWFGREGPAGIVEELGGILDNTLEQVKLNFQGKVIITTLSCLGEDLEGEENLIRARFNKVIRDLAAKHGCTVADVGKAFDEVLRKRQGRGGLFLTIDGVHINSRGAELYAREIGRSLF